MAISPSLAHLPRLKVSIFNALHIVGKNEDGQANRIEPRGQATRDACRHQPVARGMSGLAFQGHDSFTWRFALRFAACPMNRQCALMVAIWKPSAKRKLEANIVAASIRPAGSCPALPY
ncbi:hypothetical protein VFPPC_01538 [Pochonia chlamydosporia 170]|uniref:Uncharacterized protein n=1 Tax=Pochonia chlamydosporia 170 TaxID=1380566 RepID=A0A179G812_METCM|nr:hypothetical protein VFPPC_01538 [Pochonia chlamydosporia 170]OAQ73937.2 hypothetical protein VFPPC_01538 [Pochonia chlamydosporia 170]